MKNSLVCVPTDRKISIIVRQISEMREKLFLFDGKWYVVSGNWSSNGNLSATRGPINEFVLKSQVGQRMLALHAELKIKAIEFCQNQEITGINCRKVYEINIERFEALEQSYLSSNGKKRVRMCLNSVSGDIKFELVY